MMVQPYMYGAPLPFESDLKPKKEETEDEEYDQEMSHESNSTYFQYEKEFKDNNNDMGSVRSKNPKPIGRR